MASGTLYTYPNNYRALKVLVAAQFSGTKLNVVCNPPNFVLGETNKSAEFLKKFPLGKVPALETKDGKYIFESNAISHYVGNEQLRGKTAIDQAHIVQWINFADNDILPAGYTLVYPTLSIVQPNKQAVDQAKEDIKKVLTILNNHLQTRTYLVGERITQADIAVSCALLLLYEHVLEPSMRASSGNVTRWFETLINQPQFKAVVTDFKFCDKAAQFDGKKYAEFSAKHSKDKKKGDASGDAAAPDKEKASKKQEKQAKKEAKEEDEELDATEVALLEEPKQKDPFENYPKGTFNMDEFKRVYSNESETVSVPFFWDKLDKEHYSIWFCEYKFPQELTKTFMSCNLITGMFQRLDKMRKHAFGSMILFGTDNNSTISGVWIWRGHDLAFTLHPDCQIDYESYSWTKLNPDDPATKTLVSEYLSWSGEFGGKQFNQGKIFK